MNQQLGWSHVFKTTVAGADEALTQLEQERRWRDRHVVADETVVFDTRAVFDAIAQVPGGRRPRLKLRMAKAHLRSDTR